MTRTLEATRRDLTDLPSLYSLLPLFAQPGSSGEERRASTNPSRPPTNLGVVDLLDTREKAGSSPVRDDYNLDKRAGARRQGILPTLGSWVRLVDGELHDEGREHVSPDEAATVASECAFLLLHLGWVHDQTWFGELAADVKRMREDCRQAIGEPGPSILVCTVVTCGWSIEALDGGKAARCTGCGREWSNRELERLHLEQQPMTLAEIAPHVNKPVGTLYDWASKKKLWIKPVARDNGVSLFLLLDVQRAALGIRPGVPTTAHAS